MHKLLVIRFGSIGDIIQALGIPQAFKTQFPESEVHWLTKQDFSYLIEFNPSVDKVIPIPQNVGLLGLIKLAVKLRFSGYTHIYDAHNNLRSLVVIFVMRIMFGKFNFLQRPKNRWKRFQYFWLKKRNAFVMPFRGQYSYLRPLAAWFGKTIMPPAPQLYFPQETIEFVQKKITVPGEFIAVVPSAAWTMKRWPQEYWKNLIELIPEASFVILGGPTDQFCEKYSLIDPKRIQNLAGKLTLIESCAVIKLAKLTISGDTGLLHAADQLGVPALALIGPTAFGYPSRPSTQILEVNHLECKPCSKDGSGKCSQTTFRQCLVDLKPATVAAKAKELL